MPLITRRFLGLWQLLTFSCSAVPVAHHPALLIGLKPAPLLGFSLVVKVRGAQSTVLMWVTAGARAWHMGSLTKPCLLRTQSQTVSTSNSCAIYKFGKKNNAGEGQNTNTLACGPNICMKRVVWCSNTQCTTLVWHLSHNAHSIANQPPPMNPTSCRR